MERQKDESKRLKKNILLIITFILCANFTFIFTNENNLTNNNKIINKNEENNEIRVQLENEIEKNEEWIEIGAPKRDEILPIYFAFKLENSDWLRRFFWDVSSPSNPLFGKFLNKKEINEKTSPTEKTIFIFKNWLKKELNFNWKIEFDDQIKQTNFLKVYLNVDQIEKLLLCKLMKFHHENDQNKQIIRSINLYSVPNNIGGLIDFIGGLVVFPDYYGKFSPSISSFLKRGAPPLEEMIVNPEVIRERYNISDPIYSNGGGGNGSMIQAVHEFDDQYYSESDLSLFLQRNQLPNNTVSNVIGYNNQSMDGGEADLDLQYIMGIGVNIPTWFISFPDIEGDPFLDWIIFMNSLSISPLVNSISYGSNERFITKNYLNRTSEDLMKFGASGHSLFFSSGDYGVGCNCNIDKNGKIKYVAHFPASSPYVTSVGATHAFPSSANSTEIGIDFSGGGFSTYFPRESFQDAAVNAFLQSSEKLPEEGLYNGSNRGYPDLCALGINYEIYEHGGLDYIGGTSASTPTVAGIFSLINNARLINNLPPLGFLSPMLYQLAETNPDVFNDIKRGNNGDEPCCEGFTAQAGWDPMTGLGSPNYGRLLDVLLYDQLKK